MLTKNPSLFKKFDNLVRGIANGITFGLADVAAGIGDSLPLIGRSEKNSVSENIERQFALTEQARKEGDEEEFGTYIGAFVGGEIAARAVLGKNLGSGVVDMLGYREVIKNGTVLPEESFAKIEKAAIRAAGIGAIVPASTIGSLAMPEVGVTILPNSPSDSEGTGPKKPSRAR